MTSENRKPFLIAASCAAVAVLVFFLGSGLGGRDDGGTAGWKDRLGELNLSTDLEMSELQPVGGNCSIETPRITITGSCAVKIAEFGSPFSLATTKRAELVAVEPVKLTITVEGTSTSQSINAGCQISAVFGRSGGALTVSCRIPTFPCAIELGPGKDCSKE